MTSIINGFIIFSLIITSAYFFGLITQFTEHEKNKCEMTFMFEYPQYVRVANPIDDNYPRYGLYAYSEGRSTEKARNMYFDGIPVLFIPGNAGSHRQGRSFSSVALRKALHSRTPFHFDHFALDLNEELSGLNGALLFDQLAYANASIYRILELYEGRKNPPHSVVLIGHSMGGVIARRLISDLPPDSDLIPIVITLASPHRHSPLITDQYMNTFYKGIKINGSKSLTTFISITGGHRDFLVPSHLTKSHDGNNVDIVTTHIPRSWLDGDHVCVLWCKQMVLAVTRALFDVVDPKTKQISTDDSLRNTIFHHHAVKHSGINSKLYDSYEIPRFLRNEGEWVETLARQYTISVPAYSSKTNFYMIRLINQPQHEAVTIVGINLDSVDWVYACGAHIPQGNIRVCENFTHLTHKSEIIPSAFQKRRSITVNLHELMRNDSTLTHVVLRVPRTDNAISFHVDVYNPAERQEVVTLPHFFNLKKHVLVSQTPEKSVHYELIMSNFYHVIDAYQLFVDALECTGESRHATANLIVSWGYENQHKHFLRDDDKPFLMRLYNSRPQGFSNRSVRVKFTLDPSCRYRISVRTWIPGLLSNLSRLYSPMLIVNIAAVILMSLTAQLSKMSKECKSCIFFTALTEGAKPYYILTTVKLVSRAFSVKPLSIFFPTPDWLTMSQEGTDFFLLPLLLYVCSVGLVWILAVILSVSLVCFETTVHKYTLKFLARTVSFTMSWSDHIISALHKLPFVVALVLVFISVTTSGGLALCVGVVFYFLRLTQMSQDYIEELVWSYVRKFTANFKKQKKEKKSTKNDEKGVKDNANNDHKLNNDPIYFHATLFMLWTIVAAINVPSVLTWAHNFKYNPTLKPDPAFIPGIILSLCAIPLWQMELPKIERRYYNELAQIVSFFATATLIYAPISIFRLNYVIAGTIAMITVHQLIAPSRNQSEMEMQTSQSVPSSWSYESIKAKLE